MFDNPSEQRVAVNRMRTGPGRAARRPGGQLEQRERGGMPPEGVAATRLGRDMTIRERGQGGGVGG